MVESNETRRIASLGPIPGGGKVNVFKKNRVFGRRSSQHLVHRDNTPLTNLQLTLLGMIGVRMERFGDSTGEFKERSGLA